MEVVVKLPTAKSAEPLTEIRGVPVKSKAVQLLFLIVNDFVIELPIFAVPKSVLSAVSGVVSPFVISILLDEILIAFPCIVSVI